MDEELYEQPLSYRTWGEENIDSGAIDQMNNAMRLPISVAGALMPDAHVGYGLPIGGVLATAEAVIPYAVGVDIACRMRLSIFDLSPNVLGQQVGKFENALLENTRFGAGGSFKGADRAQHEVMDDPNWEATGFLNSLKDKAYAQLGTSGSGNHFVEWGALSVSDQDDELGVSTGNYLALLSHSGSRGVGFQIANRFSKLAMDQHPNLDKSVRHLSWLPLDWQLGHEYWISMQLAGRFASANHYVIHDRIGRAVGLKPLSVVENHHNFAWKQTIQSPSGTKDVIVHRKGSTPAGEGVLGVIPGTMGDAGYVVRGLGNPESLDSAAHGAGREMSRTQAKKTITKPERDRYLKERGIKLFGGDLDEAPQAYKSIDRVMEAQSDLVDIIAKFEPRIVRMDGRIGDSSIKRNRKTGKRKHRKGRR